MINEQSTILKLSFTHNITLDQNYIILFILKIKFKKNSSFNCPLKSKREKL